MKIKNSIVSLMMKILRSKLPDKEHRSSFLMGKPDSLTDLSKITLQPEQSTNVSK